MEALLMTLVIILVVVNIVFAIIFISRKNNSKKDGEGSQNLGLVLEHLTRTIDSKINESSKQVNELGRIVDRKVEGMQESMRVQLTESSRLIKEITNELTQVKEIGRQTMGFADQLQNLQDILKNPKQRGILGEYYLETLLKNVLPPGQYQMQYEFNASDENSGKIIVDAAVFVKDKIIPIDSKFSLENYNKLVEEKNPIEKEKLEKAFVNDLKNRIQETAKYIRPTEGTMDFAFMFIPHEAIYYDLLINKIGAITEETDNLIQRAANKYKVIIVSPTSFLAYLQTVLQGLKALQIEETAKDIIKRVSDLGTHLKKYEEFHGKLGISLSTVVNHYNNSNKELKKVDKDVLRITDNAPGIEVEMLEKPENGEG